MKPYLTFPVRLAAGILLVLLGAITPALAGPPLICHRIEIGTAKSLPWNGAAWNLSGNENYDTKNLARDTLAILGPSTPVVIRMETLRRATLYARKDPQAAKELFTKLFARAASNETAAHPDALAWFDAGYLAEAYNQFLGKEGQNPAAGIDGYSLVKKALALRGQDPEMEFAAAMITLSGPQKDHQEHVQKAIAGAKGDPLLAQNLSSHFMGNDQQSVSQMLTKNTAGGLEK